MLSELTPEEIDHMLTSQFFGRIGCAGEGRVLIVPVGYYYDGHSIYGLTREGTKVQLLRQNPAVCFEIDEVVDANHWRSVVVEGTFEELKDYALEDALYLLKNRKIPVFADERMGYPGVAAPPDRIAVYPVVYRIHINHKTGRQYTLESAILTDSSTAV